MKLFTVVINYAAHNLACLTLSFTYTQDDQKIGKKLAQILEKVAKTEAKPKYLHQIAV
jgi:hypothetical protein